MGYLGYVELMRIVREFLNFLMEFVCFLIWFKFELVVEFGKGGRERGFEGFGVVGWLRKWLYFLLILGEDFGGMFFFLVLGRRVWGDLKGIILVFYIFFFGIVIENIGFKVYLVFESLGFFFCFKGEVIFGGDGWVG